MFAVYEAFFFKLQWKFAGLFAAGYFKLVKQLWEHEAELHENTLAKRNKRYLVSQQYTLIVQFCLYFFTCVLVV